MGTEIVMPKLSDTMEEGTILKWLKQVGDRVEAGEVIAEVETDKADMELEAAASGVLSKIQVPAGEQAAVGAVIALLDGNPADAGASDAKEAAPTPPRAKPSVAAKGETPAPAKPAKAGQSGKAVKAAEETGSAEPANGGETAEVKASAAARALATERGIDLATLKGSGPAGRIVSEDVEAASGEGGRPAAARASTPKTPAAPAERHQLSRMRQSIARRMSEAFREIPHFSVTAEIDMSEAVRLKAALDRDGTFDVPVTYTHMVLKATARALTRHPRLNASYRDDALEVHADVNLGIAVSVEDGLIVPVLRHADARSLADIAVETRRLVGLTKQGRFATEDLSGATFTVSNMGMLDIEAFTAVINPPQAAILAVGTIKQRAVVRNGALAVASTMFVTVSCDHRIIDGVVAGRFLEELKTLLESPIGLVIA